MTVGDKVKCRDFRRDTVFTVTQIKGDRAFISGPSGRGARAQFISGWVNIDRLYKPRKAK